MPDMRIVQLLERVEWKLQKEEVLRRFKDAEASTPHPSKNAHMFVFGPELVPLGLMTYFDSSHGERLLRIQLHLGGEEPIPDDMLDKMWNEIKLELIAKYGVPTYEMMDAETTNQAMAQSAILPKGTSFSESLAWAPPNSILTLHLSLRRDGAAQPGVSIGYGDVENDPISRSWAWIRGKS